MRGNHAHLCVEVDLGKPLKLAVKILDRLYHVEYEGLHLICFQCGQLGHRKEGCMEVSLHNTGVSGEDADASHSTSRGIIGAWTGDGN